MSLVLRPLFCMEAPYLPQQPGGPLACFTIVKLRGQSAIRRYSCVN